MDNFGNLRAIGERPLDASGRRWSRFQTEHPIPSNCDVRGVRARFDNNILYISFPKVITEERKSTVPPTPTPELEKNRPLTPEPQKERPPTTEPKKERPPMPEQKQEPESKKEKEEQVKEKEEQEGEDADHGEKEEKGGGAAVAAATDVAPAPEKIGIGFLEVIRRPRQAVINMFVAVLVIVVIGIYVGYKLRSGGWGPRGE